MGEGTGAQFRNPMGVAIAPDGSFALIADENNHAIRKVVLTPPYAVSNVAGAQCFAATCSTFVDGVGKMSRFRWPTGVAIAPSGDAAFVSDRGNHAIRRVDLDTRRVTTVAGVPGLRGGYADGVGAVAKFNQPRGVAIAPGGRLLVVCDTGNHRLRLVALRDGRAYAVSDPSHEE